MAAEATGDFILDLTDYKETQGAYVPPGDYVTVIEDAELGKSTQKKTPQLTLWLRVIGTDYDGLTLVENLYLTAGSRFRTVAFLNALGIPTPKGAKIPLKVRQFLQRRVIVTMIDDEYNGRKRAKVDQFSRYMGKNGTPTDAAEALDLSEFAEGDGTSDEVTDLPDEEQYVDGMDEDDLAVGSGNAIAAPESEDDISEVAADPEPAPAPRSAAPKAAAPKQEEAAKPATTGEGNAATAAAPAQEVAVDEPADEEVVFDADDPGPDDEDAIDLDDLEDTI